jgi:hypothetical protein
VENTRHDCGLRDHLQNRQGCATLGLDVVLAQLAIGNHDLKNKIKQEKIWYHEIIAKE